MGGKSTSHGAVLEGRKNSESSKYDLRSWQGLTEVLKVGKESLRDPRAYAEFRNLVLEYAQKGGDVELRAKIDTIIASFGKINTQTQTVQQEPPRVPVSIKTRLESQQPSQTSSETKSTPPSPSVPPIEHASLEPSSTVPGSPVLGEPTQFRDDGVAVRGTTRTPLANGEITEESIRAFVGGMRRAQPQFEMPKSDVYTPEQSSPMVPAPEKQSEPQPPTTVNPTPAQTADPYDMPDIPAPTAPIDVFAGHTVTEPNPHEESSTEQSPTHKSLDAHKARIAEIKRIIHEQIGNPAALIDTHNAVGKRYMTALLTALKATAPGSGSGADSAMTNLESVFTELLHDAPKTDVVEPTPESHAFTSSETSEPTNDLSDRTRMPEDVTPPQTSKPIPISLKIPVKQSLERKSIPEQKSPEPPHNHTPLHESTEDRHTSIQSSPIPKKISPSLLFNAPSGEPSHTIRHSAADTLAELTSDLTPNLRAQEEPLSAQHDILVPPVREEMTKNIAQPYIPPAIPHAIHTSTHEPNPAQLFTAPPQAELSSSEIDAALKQLLDEWPLFSGSGFFGTGPGGIEHPLYRSLSNLSMGEVIAGRWEGSNATTTKAIKEYVDAWRHEQGVAYTISETFEHYLRRVLQRILKRQQIAVP